MENSHRPLRIAITGATGLLGRTLLPLLASRGHAVIAGCHHPTNDPALANAVVPLDLLDPVSVEAFLKRAEADLVIHTAALTDVDRCEQEPELAKAINTDATLHLVSALAQSGCRLLHLSTDYVFDGNDGPYDESATPGPINCYGHTKLEAERIVRSSACDPIIVRSASFLGVGTPDRPTWVEKMVETMLNHPPLPAATNQRSNITPVEFLASELIEIVESSATGLRHVAGDQNLSRYDFALRLARLFALGDEVVRAVPYADLNRSARRPLNGGLISRFPPMIPQPPLDTVLANWKETYLRNRINRPPPE